MTESTELIGGDCDVQGCKRAAYQTVGPVKVCGDAHAEVAREKLDGDYD